MTDFTPEMPEAPEIATTPKKTSKQSKLSRLGIWLFTLLTLCVALSALYMNLQLTQNVNHSNKLLNASLNRLTQQENNTALRLKAHRAVTRSHEDRAKQARNTLEKHVKTTLAEYQNLPDDWRLLKARHLLKMASLNAHWGTNNTSTTAMLKEADTILAPLHNPALLAVRKAIALDVHAIQSAPTTDITVLLTQLDAALESTSSLSINPLPQKETTATTATSNNVTHPVLHFFKHLVTIQYNPNQLLPKPTLAFEAMLRATIRLNLAEAQWAVLEQNNAVYQLALNQAIHGLEHSFVSNAASTKALIQLLSTLKQTQLYSEQVIPDKALTAINQVISTTEHSQSGDAS